MRETRLIIVEGIMGSGKSTLSAAIARRMRRMHLRARLVPERFRSHPTSVTVTLTHWRKIWIEHTPESFMAHSLRNWRAFADQAARSASTSVFDGQFFHGDMTGLFIANTPRAAITAYIDQVAEIVEPLRPVLIYLYQADVAWGLQRTAAARGKSFLRRQTEWKVDSPYALERGYAGVDGLFKLYRDYRQLTDELYARLPLPKLAVENSAGAWERDERLVWDFLGLTAPDEDAPA